MLAESATASAGKSIVTNPSSITLTCTVQAIPAVVSVKLPKVALVTVKSANSKPITVSFACILRINVLFSVGLVSVVLTVNTGFVASYIKLNDVASLLYPALSWAAFCGTVTTTSPSPVGAISTVHLSPVLVSIKLVKVGTVPT